MPQSEIDVAIVEWIAGAFLALLNIVVCIAVARSGRFTRGQVAAQVLLVWLLPILGVAAIGMFLWTELHPARTSNSGDSPGMMTAGDYDAGGHGDGGGDAA